MEIEQRVAKLEWIVDGHAEEIKEIRDTSEATREALVKIEKNLSQIKYIAVGAGLMFFLREIGLMDLIRIFTL